MVAIQADVSRSEDVNRMVEEGERILGKIDILINNAGMIVRTPIVECKDSDIDRIIDTNLKAPLYLCRVVGKGMIERRWGRVINIGSLHTLVSIEERSIYAATKGGIHQVSKCLSLEWAKYGITVNTICPGVFRTEINEEWMKDKERAKKMLDKIPVGFFGEPHDLSGAVIYLCSDAARYVTGTAIVIDGGYTAQ